MLRFLGGAPFLYGRPTAPAVVVFFEALGHPHRGGDVHVSKKITIDIRDIFPIFFEMSTAHKCK
jgi:hypothetical protein